MITTYCVIMCVAIRNEFGTYKIVATYKGYSGIKSEGAEVTVKEPVEEKPKAEEEPKGEEEEEKVTP